MSNHTNRASASLPLEQALCQRLGVPQDAEHVIIFAESSHWDPNWLYTSRKYYDRFVRHNLDTAIAELQRDPRRVYGVECMFFLRMYWERSPQQRDAIRALVNTNRLRLTSSGVTTADTLLPVTESLLRDWLVGQEWLRKNGMTQEPTLAYFTDSFGCSPLLPSLLQAGGFDRTAFTRIDGMYFVGCDYESAKNFPRRNSSAALLLEQEKTLDFFWRDPNGAEVLCHWNAFTYGQGDMIAYRGINRIYLVPFAVPDHSERNVANHIEQYVAQLAPYSRTRYLFCPIGFDFIEPISDLVALLDRYNRLRYPDTGVWAVNAGLDDYLTLVTQHRDTLPTLVSLDPNPYWTGFYTARPTLKERCHKAVNLLTLTEKLSLLPGNETQAQTLNETLDAPWWNAVVANHHDFITGTSPDLIVEVEQVPWLLEAIQDTHAVLDQLQRPSTPPQPSPPTTTTPSHPAAEQQDGKIALSTSRYALQLSEDEGLSIQQVWAQDTQQPLITDKSNVLVNYEDAGGLWRMGHEFNGGGLTPLPLEHAPSPPHIDPYSDGGLHVTSTQAIEEATIQQHLWMFEDRPVIYFRVVGRAPEDRTVTVRFATDIVTEALVMDQPGGVITRPPKKIYDPTFWPFQHFVHLQDPDTGHGVALCTKLPSAIAYQPGEYFEVIALRNATRERAFGFLTIPGMPATGHERESYAFDYALVFTEGDNWRESQLRDLLAPYQDTPWNTNSLASLHKVAAQIVVVDHPDVKVSAAKPASRGEGVIVRLSTPRRLGVPITLTWPGHAIAQAFLCDARERDITALDVQEGRVNLSLPGTLTTVRLLPA